MYERQLFEAGVFIKLWQYLCAYSYSCDILTALAVNLLSCREQTTKVI